MFHSGEGPGGSGDGPARRNRVRRAGAWLAHPVTVLAIIVLALNDLVLKSAYPGLVTGKLSDVAGLVVLPPLLALVLSPFPVRGAAIGAIAVTGLGFAATKSTDAGADAASALWSTIEGPSVILADRTDLLALPALGIAWWVWSRVRTVPVDRRLGTVLVVVPAAVFAVSATSAPAYQFASSVTEYDGAIVLGQATGYHPENERWTWTRMTRDGGRTWVEAPKAARELPTTAYGRKRACVPNMPQHCYRVVAGHLRVESTDDGGRTWRTAWEVTDEQRETLFRHYPDVEDPAKELSSLAIDVARPDLGLHHTVAVANGRDGFVLYNSRTDRWKRVGFVDTNNPPPPIRTSHKGTLHIYLWGLVGAVVCVAVTLEIAGRRFVAQARRRHVDKLGLAVTGAGIALLFGAVGLAYSPTSSGFFADLVPGAITTAGAASTLGGIVLWYAAVLQQRAATRRELGIVSGVALASGWLMTLLLGNPLELPISTPVAAIGCVVILALGIVVAAKLVLRSRPTAPAAPEGG